MYVKRITLQTSAYNEMIVLTPQVEETVAESGVKNGMVTVLTKHTTTGITVNEALECLESDIQIALSLFAPEDRPYSHARMLRDYGYICEFDGPAWRKILIIVEEHTVL